MVVVGRRLDDIARLKRSFNSLPIHIRQLVPTLRCCAHSQFQPFEARQSSTLAASGFKNFFFLIKIMAVRRRVAASLISKSEGKVQQRSAHVERDLSPLTDLDESQDIVNPPGKKKQTKEPVPSDFQRNVSNPWRIGAHVSAAGGVENAIIHAAEIGCFSNGNSF